MPTESVYSAANTIESLQSGVSGIRRLYIKAASLDRFGMSMLRLGLIIVLVWIGGLKFASYEADGIVPLVANTP
jgi:reactive chlorine resistance protein C